ncbi:MAG: RHS repeat-associated core domain-containing protein, partial [Methanobacteriota archaeon]
YTPGPDPIFASASFIYDGDGKRVQSVMQTNYTTTTTHFVGNYYEATSSSVTKYYYAGAQRIAMRTNGTVNYLLGDHLGSTSLSADASGTVVSELRYKAWGEVRYASGEMPTDYTYTGQYSYAGDFGLMYYNARWYDPSLGRFAQADTIVPDSVQGLDRYAYVNNSPLVYVDPTGHFDEKKQLIKWFGKNWRDLFSEAMEDILLHAEFGDMVVYAKVGKDKLLGAIFSKDEGGSLIMWDLEQKAGVSVAYVDHMSQEDVVSLYKLVDYTNDRKYRKDHSIATMSDELPEGLYLPRDDYDVGGEQYLSSNITITYKTNFLTVVGTGVGIVAIAIEGSGPWGWASFGIGLLAGFEIDGRIYTVHEYSPYSVPTPSQPTPIGTPAFGQ